MTVVSDSHLTGEVKVRFGISKCYAGVFLGSSSVFLRPVDTFGVLDKVLVTSALLGALSGSAWCLWSTVSNLGPTDRTSGSLVSMDVDGV